MQTKDTCTPNDGPRSGQGDLEIPLSADPLSNFSLPSCSAPCVRQRCCCRSSSPRAAGRTSTGSGCCSLSKVSLGRSQWVFRSLACSAVTQLCSSTTKRGNETTCAHALETVRVSMTHPSTAACMPLPNAPGREAHTISHHIAENWDTLPPLTTFLHGDTGTGPTDHLDPLIKLHTGLRAAHSRTRGG